MSLVTLYQGPSAWGIPNISPFCTKVETYLRLAKIAYQTKLGDPRTAPTRKIPYIELDGQRIGDSQQILATLKQKFGDPVDGHLSDRERARGHLLRRTLEEATYFGIVHARWCDPVGFAAYVPALTPLMPPVVGGLVLRLVRGQIAKSVYAQGAGRHPPDVLYEMGKADFDAVAAELGASSFLFGDRPTSFDAVVYAFTSGVLAFPADSPLKRHVAAQANLVAHCERMQQQVFPASRPPGSG